MHILINLQPTTKEEMIHWSAFSFVSIGSSPRLYKILTNMGLLDPKYIKAPGKYTKLFWDIAKQFHSAGKSIKEKLDQLPSSTFDFSVDRLPNKPVPEGQKSGKERGMSDEERERASNEFLRKCRKERLEGDLQMDGYILIGWYQDKSYIIPAPSYKKSHGFYKSPGKAAYLPVTGSRRIYIWETYGADAPHPDPAWGNKRFTHFVNTAKKPQRITVEKMLSLLSAPKPPYEGPCCPPDVWMPSVPLWLLDNKKDMRPLYLAGGKPE